MAHIVSVLGHRLRDMLLQDGWKLEWERQGCCHVSKGGKQRGFPLNVALPVKDVKSYAKDASWDARRFDELMQSTIVKLPAAKKR